jgi:hypothetical protein
MKNLGKQGKDKITGIEGIITSKVTYLYGCHQYGITPKVTGDGKRPETEYFDEGRIEITGPGVKPEDVQAKDPGGNNKDAPKF